METRKNEINNNAVGRLFDILQSLQENAKTQDDTLETIISRTFDDEHSDPLWIYMETIKLIQDAEKDIERLPERSRKTHLSSVLKIRSGFIASSLRHQWAHFSKFLDPATMRGLELTADALSHITNEKPIAKEDIEIIRK